MRFEQQLRSGLLSVWVATVLAGCGDDYSKRSAAPPPSADAAAAATATAAQGSAPNASAGEAVTSAPAASQPASDPTAPVAVSETPAVAMLTPQTNDTSPSADPNCYKATVTVCQLELAVLKLTNAHRPATAQLALDPKLSFVARAWSAQQQLAGAIGHSGFPDARETVYMAEFNEPIPFFLGAENVGTTYGTDKLTIDQLAGEIVDMWWNSAGHRANILGDYAAIGIGVSISADARTVMATQLFGAR